MLHDYDVKLPNFTFYGGSKLENQETRNFFFLNLDIVAYEFNLRSVRVHLRNKVSWVIETKTERTKIHILSDVFAPIASLDLKGPNMAWSSSKSTRKYISSKKYKTILIVNSLG